jgi:hypothetical protein
MRTYQLGVEVLQERSNVVVVRVNAESLREAEKLAEDHVEKLCQDEAIGCSISSNSDWRTEDESCLGVSDEAFPLADYDPDIDLTDGELLTQDEEEEEETEQEVKVLPGQLALLPLS